MKFRRPLLWAVVIFMSFGPFLSRSVAATAQAVDPTVVFYALQLIGTTHVDNPDPVKLIVGALDGLRQTLSQVGIRDLIADLDSGSEASARATFTARFNQTVGLLQGRMSVIRLEHAAINAMASSLGDTYTFFVTPQQQAESSLQGYSGVGIFFRRVDGGFYVWDVFSDGPAHRAGVREFDQIVAVDGQSVQGLTQEEVRIRIRGPERTTVTLTLRRPGRTGTLTLSIPRGFVTPLVWLEEGMLRAGIGYVRLSDFTQGVSRDMHRSLESLSRRGMRALILDLRFGGVGQYAEAGQVADLLLPSGLVLYSIVGKEPRTQQTVRSPVLDRDVRLVVLINGDTVGPAEVLAAAISEYERGRLVGVKTRGAGIVWRTYDLPGGAALTIKIGRVSTGKGMPLENNGVTPDIEVMLRAADLDRGQDPQLERATQLVLQGR